MVLQKLEANVQDQVAKLGAKTDQSRSFLCYNLGMSKESDRADFKLYYSYGCFLVNLTDKFFILKDLIGVKLMRQLFELLCNQERYLLARPYEVDEFIYHCQSDLEDGSDSDRWFWLMKPEEYRLTTFQDNYLLNFVPDKRSIIELDTDRLDKIYQRRVELLTQTIERFRSLKCQSGQMLVKVLFKTMLIQDDLPSEKYERYQAWFEWELGDDNDHGDVIK